MADKTAALILAKMRGDLTDEEISEARAEHRERQKQAEAEVEARVARRAREARISTSQARAEVEREVAAEKREDEARDRHDDYVARLNARYEYNSTENIVKRSRAYDERQRRRRRGEPAEDEA
jgi:hypothetical protein